MKKMSYKQNKIIKKFLISISVVLLLVSISGMSGIVWGDIESNINHISDPNQPDNTQNSGSQASEESGYRGMRLAPKIDLNLSTMYPHQNLTIYGGGSYDHAGSSIATGDINGDGLKDIIIGAYSEDGPLGRTDCGAVHIIFGVASFPDPGTKDLATQADIIIYGIDQNDYIGESLAAGDVNGDGKDDIIIGASSGSGANNGRLLCGEVYVVFGNETFPSTIDLNINSPDVTIYGQEEGDSIGQVVASGDMSGDNKQDIIIGATYASGPNNARPYCGEVYIINGQAFSSPPITIDLNTTVGAGPDTVIFGADGDLSFIGDQAGTSIATGNIDGSGRDDLIIGAPFACGPDNNRTGCGEVYLIYGTGPLAGIIDLNTTTADTHADVIIYGIDGETLLSIGDQTGLDVTAGDVIGNSIDDIIIGAPGAAGPANNRTECGEVYVIKGKNNFPDIIDLNISAGGIGPDVLIYGADLQNMVGKPIETCDLNNDLKAEIIICAPFTISGPNDDRMGAGEIYIINGSNSLPTTFDINITTSTPHHDGIIWGANSTDTAGISIASGDLNGNNLEDLIIGAPDADGINKNKPDSGEIYVLGILKQDLNPWIMFTVPSNGTTGVALNAPIIVNFSEPMNHLTLQYSCYPPVSGGFTDTWNAEYTEVNFTHSNDFQEKTLYQFKITAGLDFTGKSLIQHPNLLILNPWNFTTGDFTNPMVTGTTPAHNASKVKLDEGIEIRFSEPMNTTTLKFTCEPDPGGWQIPIWNATNETVIYNHTNPFQELTGYWFNLTTGNDTWDWPLVPNPDPKIPNSIRFWTGDFTSPKILITVPANNTINVEVNASIIVTFSEPMNASTLTLNCQPVVPSGFSPQWNANNDRLIYTHSDDFAYNTWYNITISGAKDLAGNDLIEGLEPNPWRFKTEGLRPKIIMTDPVNNSENVPLNKDIIITFSKPMNNASITYTCDPMPSGGFSAHWNPNNTKATYKHAIDFDKITTYEFKLTAGIDIDDKELILDINNPLIFITVGDNPIILETTPANDANNIYSYADIKVKFSETMDVDTVKFKCTADPGGWKTPIWNAKKDEVTFSHLNPFNKNTEYTFEITEAKDLEGFDIISGDIPNPWSFTTAGDNPMLIETIPKNGATQVLLDADIIVKFSKPMKIETVQFNCIPAVTGNFTPDWNLDKTEVSFKHTTNFAKTTLYTFRIIAAKDQEGFNLIQGNIPNPWQFTTIGENPIIISTYPAHDTTGVPLDAKILVEFSKPMDAATVAYTCAPLPQGGFTNSWNDDGDIITFHHTTEFNKNTSYTFEITGGKGIGGYDLVQSAIPNPWTFRTIGDEPVIFSTDPKDNEADVELNRKITILFSKSMNADSIEYKCSSDFGDPGGWTETWSEDGKKLTLDHLPFKENSRYEFEITVGEDLDGRILISGPVPNPFEFKTGTGKISDLLTMLKSPSNGTKVDKLTPMLAWDGSDDAIMYYVYLGKDKMAVVNHDKSLERITQDTSYTPIGKLDAGTTYYWTVISSDGKNNGTCEVWSFITPSEEISEDKDVEDWWMGVIVVIIIVIVLILLAFLMLKRKKRPPTEEDEEPAAPPTPPSAEPSTGDQQPRAAIPQVVTVSDAEPSEAPPQSVDTSRPIPPQEQSVEVTEESKGFEKQHPTIIGEIESKKEGNEELAAPQQIPKAISVAEAGTAAEEPPLEQPQVEGQPQAVLLSKRLIEH